MAIRIFNFRIILAFFASSAMILGLSAPAAASDTQLIVSTTPAELVIGDPALKSEGITLEVFLSSSKDLEVRVEFVDYLAGEGQGRSALPAGTTPYSLANALDVVPFNGEYTGSGRQQRYEIQIVPKKDFKPSIYFGAISVSSAPLGGPKKVAGASGSIIKSLTVTPFGIAASLADSGLAPATIYRHDLKPLQRSSMIDSILPDLPGVVNFGAVESSVYYRNQGQIPVFASLSWKFESNGVSLASRNLQKALISPGEETLKSVRTQVSGNAEGVLLNVLPSFGFVSNQITLSSSLGGTELPVQSYDGSFLVMQWKEPFVALLGIYFLVRWAYRRNLSAKARAESASLVSLAIRDFFRKYGRKPKAVQEVSATATVANAVKPNYYPASYAPPGYPLNLDKRP